MKRFLKQCSALLCTLLLLACLFPMPAGAADEKTPDPKIIQADIPASVAKGSPFEATFTFQQQNDKGEFSSKGNLEGFDLESNNKDDYNIIITVTSANRSIELGKSTYSFQNGEIQSIEDDDSGESSNSTNINAFYYRLTIPEKEMKRIGNDIGTLRFKITYKKDDSKVTTNVQKTVFQKIEGTSSEDSSVLTVQSYSVNPVKELKEGDKFTLNLAIKNNGSSACKNVSVGVTVDGSIYVNGSTNTKHIDSIGAGATAQVSFPLAAMSKLESKSYPVTVTLSSPDAGTGTNAPILYIPVTGTVKNKDDNGGLTSSRPQMIIESYDYGGMSVTGGKTFTLTMNFKNTSPNIAIENLKMTIAAAADGDKGTVAFTPANSSNTFFIAKVNGGAKFQKKMDLYPKVDADPKSYGITVSYTYEAVIDGTRQDKLEGTETIAIPLSQPDRFEVNEAELPSPIYMGEPGQLNINYVNKGKSKIFNLSVKLEGNFTSPDSDTYIGNVESGTGDSFQASIEPQGEGPLQGKATFSYEDANGEIKEVVKEFSGDVTAMNTPNIPGDGEIPTDVVPQKGGLPVVKIGIGVGVLIVAIVVVVLVRKRKAKKKQLALEEDDYDDEIADFRHSEDDK